MNRFAKCMMLIAAMAVVSGCQSGKTCPEDSGTTFAKDALMPFVHEMADKYGDKIKFCALNTTKARRLAISQKILGLPVIAIYENGQMIDSCVKEDATPENVEAMIKKYV